MDKLLCTKGSYIKKVGKLKPCQYNKNLPCFLLYQTAKIVYSAPPKISCFVLDILPKLTF